MHGRVAYTIATLLTTYDRPRDNQSSMPLTSRARQKFAGIRFRTVALSQIQLLLGSPKKCIASLENSPEQDVAGERALDLAKCWPQLDTAKQHKFFKNVVRRVVVGQTAVWIDIERIVFGEVGTVTQLAKKTWLSSVYVKRMMSCATLSPHMTEMILSGRHRPDLTLQELLQNVPVEWAEQPLRLG